MNPPFPCGKKTCSIILCSIRHGWRQNESVEKQEVEAPGNLWESLEQLGLRILPRCHARKSQRLMPLTFGSPSQWRVKAASSSCQKLTASIAGLDAAQLLHASYMGALWKANLFPTSQCPHPSGSVIPHPPTPLHSHH